MGTVNIKTKHRERRRKRIRAKVSGTSKTPRLSVFKSNKHVSVQLIDDDKGNTLFSYWSKSFKGKNLTDKAKSVGKKIAEEAVKKGVKKAVFDRGGYLYTGVVKALADGAREGGLKF